MEKRASLVISDAKSFKILTLGVNFLEPFFFLRHLSSKQKTDKLERSSPTSLSVLV